MEINEKYTEILKLRQMLCKAGIPHSLSRMYDGWQIIYFCGREQVADVVQHRFSYGAEKDMLELQGLLKPQEKEYDDVAGYLSANEVFKRIKKDFFCKKQKNKSMRDKNIKK